MSYLPVGSSYQASPAGPTGTTNTTGVMMGLAGSITPKVSGTVLFIISGDMTNTVAADGLQIGGRYGTGSAPANGDATPGSATVFGVLKKLVSRVDSASLTLPFSIQGIATLTIGTTYWIDIYLSAVTGGTASISFVNISAFEQ